MWSCMLLSEFSSEAFLILCVCTQKCTLPTFSHSDGMFSFDQTTKTRDEGNSILLQRLREKFGRELVGGRETQRGESVRKTKSAWEVIYQSLALWIFFFQSVNFAQPAEMDHLTAQTAELDFKVNGYWSHGYKKKSFSKKKQDSNVLIFAKVLSISKSQQTGARVWVCV